MYIGIDVGGTNLKAGLVDEAGKIVKVERVPLDFQGPEKFAETLAELSKKVIEEKVRWVGVGLPGAVDGGDVLFTTNIPMENVPLEQLFRRHLDLPLLLGNDADCAAVGEFFGGAGKGTRDFAVVTLGTGVGAVAKCIALAVRDFEAQADNIRAQVAGLTGKYPLYEG